MIHSIKIDDDIEERLKEFQAKLPPAQKIVSMQHGSGYLFVHTEASHQERSKNRNLLLEELDSQKARERLNRG